MWRIKLPDVFLALSSRQVQLDDRPLFWTCKGGYVRTYPLAGRGLSWDQAPELAATWPGFLDTSQAQARVQSGLPKFGQNATAPSYYEPMYQDILLEPKKPHIKHRSGDRDMDSDCTRFCRLGFSSFAPVCVKDAIVGYMSFHITSGQSRHLNIEQSWSASWPKLERRLHHYRSR